LKDQKLKQRINKQVTQNFDVLKILHYFWICEE